MWSQDLFGDLLTFLQTGDNCTLASLENKTSYKDEPMCFDLKSVEILLERQELYSRLTDKEFMKRSEQGFQ